VVGLMGSAMNTPISGPCPQRRVRSDVSDFTPAREQEWQMRIMSAGFAEIDIPRMGRLNGTFGSLFSGETKTE
jgi:hypothetical protein